MQKNQQFSPLKPSLSLANQADVYMLNAPMSSIFGETVCRPGATSLLPFHNVEFQSSEACPRNFIIFDQTDNKTQVILHRATGSRFCYPDPNTWAAPPEYNADKFAKSEQREVISLKEDSDDINALLSSDDDHEEYGDEELSTARTDVYYGSNSPDSCSNYEYSPRKMRPISSTKTSADVSSCTGRKRQKMRKMVEALRGIVPGADQMDTVTVLDEAVGYLKSLKVEAQKLGVGKLKRCT